MSEIRPLIPQEESFYSSAIVNMEKYEVDTRCSFLLSSFSLLFIYCIVYFYLCNLGLFSIFNILYCSIFNGGGALANQSVLKNHPPTRLR